MKKIFYFVSFLLPTFVQSQNLQDLVRERVEAGETPGMAVAWLEDNKVGYFNYGYATIETKDPVTSKTLFEIGSITKTFTCSVLSLLVSKKELSLDAPAQKYLPASIRLPERNGQPITLLHLATARSGLPRMPTNFNPANPANPYIDYTEKELASFLNNYELTRDPGSQYEYSNLGMGTLGYLLARQRKTTYSKLIAKNIFVPLKMNQSFISGEEQPKLLATGYADKTPMRAWTWSDQSVLTGAGGIVSNTEDMIKYLTAQLDDNGSALTLAFKEAHKERADASANNQIAMGWHLKDHKYVWHNGGTGGFRSLQDLIRKRKEPLSSSLIPLPGPMILVFIGLIILTP